MSDNNKSSLRKVVDEMEAKLEEIKYKMGKIEQCLALLRDNCEHKYEWVANTHNHDIHECVDCGHRMRI